MTPTSPAVAPRVWEAVRKEVRGLSRYAADWDGAGADTVPEVLIRAASEWLSRVEERGGAPPDMVYPIADGSIMVEWHHPGGLVESGNIRDALSVELLRQEPGGAPTASRIALVEPVGDDFAQAGRRS